MRHPFDGVPSTAEGSDPVGLTRRAALGQMTAGAAGLLGVAAGARAGLTTGALGEEGGVPSRVGGEDGRSQVTTEPFGEEGGKVVSRAEAGLEDAGKTGPATTALGEEGGPAPTTVPLGEEGAVRITTGRIGEEGGMTRPRGEEGGIGHYVVPVKPETIELDEKLLDQLWNTLGDEDPASGVQACAILYGAKHVVPFLKKKFAAASFVVSGADDKTLTRLIAELDSDQYRARERAMFELERLGPAVVDRLKHALAEAGSAEQRRRLERLVADARTHSVQVQGRRGLEVLVALRSLAAKDLLEALAKGPEKDWLTERAKEALARAK
jgi:hypothetical protein